jgi:hypothetical protein
MLVGGGMAALPDAFERPPSARVLGTDAPVNVGADDSADISAHNSPALARNPTRPDNLAVSSRVDTPFFSCGLHVSSDGGASWSQIPIPAPAGEEAKCFAPDLAFSADGTLHLSFVTLRGSGNVPNAVWVSSSKDGGRTLSDPVQVAGRLAFQVRLAADPVDPERLYMTWLQASDVATLKFTETGNPIQVARSDDGGASWSEPVRVSEPSRERVIAPSPVVGPEGEVYVLYLDIGEDRLDYAGAHEGMGGPPYDGAFRLVLGRSRDGGATWGESEIVDPVDPIQRFIVFLPAFPSVAVDDSGRVYAAFHDDRLGDPDVWLWTLDPGESDWRGPTRVNDTARRDGTWQYLPKVSVSPDGRVDVVYYDRRSDRGEIMSQVSPQSSFAGRSFAPALRFSSPPFEVPEVSVSPDGRLDGVPYDPRSETRNVMNHVSLQSSYDAGRSFTPALRLSSRSFDSRIGFGAKEGLPDLGSRLGLISTDQAALGLWTDTRAGTPETQKQDLAKTVVAVAGPEGLAEPVEAGLRYGGLALGVAGLGVLILWLLAPRRPIRGSRGGRRSELEPGAGSV